MAKLSGRMTVAFLLLAGTAQAQKLSAPPNVCSAIEKGETFSMEALEKRIADRKLFLGNKDEVESSCKMVSLVSGFGALSSIWIKENEDGIPMHLMAQIRQQGRTCEIHVYDKEGC